MTGRPAKFVHRHFRFTVREQADPTPARARCGRFIRRSSKRPVTARTHAGKLTREGIPHGRPTNTCRTAHAATRGRAAWTASSRTSRRCQQRKDGPSFHEGTATTVHAGSRSRGSPPRAAALTDGCAAPSRRLRFLARRFAHASPRGRAAPCRLGESRPRDGRVFPLTANLRRVLEDQHQLAEQLKEVGILTPSVFMFLVGERPASS